MNFKKTLVIVSAEPLQKGTNKSIIINAFKCIMFVVGIYNG